MVAYSFALIEKKENKTTSTHGRSINLLRCPDDSTNTNKPHFYSFVVAVVVIDGVGGVIFVIGAALILIYL